VNSVTPKEMMQIIDFVETNCGLQLNDSKSYLVDSRLGPLLPELGIDNYSELVTKSISDRTGKLKHRIIDAITTNETYFFRDEKPFDLLAHKLIPDTIEKSTSGNRVSLCIWSAAASTGQEVYSIAMVLKELLGQLHAHDIKILGTDISHSALEIASRGLYGKVELARGLTGTRLKRHFTQTGNLWRINDDLRAVASFRQLNLLTGTVTIPQQDIILCRNVAFYFSKENKQRLFNNLAQKLPVGGALVIGSTESLVGMSLPFEKRAFHGNIYYEKVK
jgi:chemotaxis protein methyltransferase CheR